MNQRGFISTIIGFVIVIIFALGVGGYVYMQSQMSDSTETIPASYSHGNKPVPSPVPPQPVACTKEARICPDGSVVGRTGPKCEFVACPMQKGIHQVTISQGIYGYISLRSGDCTPRPPDQTARCNLSKVSRKVFVYPLIKDTSTIGTFFLPDKNFTKEVFSDSSGFYQIELPVGDFSIFVEDDEKKYCSISNGQHELCPVTVTKGEKQQYDIEINHAVE